MVVGNGGNLAPRDADRREPSGSSAVEGPGGSRHQRPETSGALAQEEAPHDAHGQNRKADFSVAATVADGASAVAAQASRPRGRRPQKWVVRVTAIDPQTHPEFLRNPRHPCAGMKPEDRLEDIISFCARLWARTCEDIAKEVAETQRRAKAA